MKHSILCSGMLAITLCLSFSGAIAQPAEFSGSDRYSIFDNPPQETNRFITREAFSAYYENYKDAKNYKAFAQSEGGAWAYVTSRSSQEAANEEVLAACQGYNKKFSDTYPCQLLTVGNDWTHEDNKAREIIQSLPSFSPEIPLDFNAFEDSFNDDIANERYADALAKRVWYHQNAILIKPSLAGVRLSFALSDWIELGREYPPAKTLLRYAANDAMTKIYAEPKDAFSTVIDYTAINRALERPDQSVSLFIWLDTHYPEQADLYFGMFQEALLELQQYTLHSKYLSPNFEYSSIALRYNASKRRAQRHLQKSEGLGQVKSNDSTKRFIYDVSHLVAILVLSDRNQEAELVTQKAKLELDTPEFTQALETAFEGKLPEPIYGEARKTEFKRVKVKQKS